MDPLEQVCAVVTMLHMFGHRLAHTLCCTKFAIGKTMTANAVAHCLSKKVLLVTVSALTDRDVTKVIFNQILLHG